MATKEDSGNNDGLKELEKQLECTVCLDTFKTPRTLPCLHSFCQECLEGVPLNKEGEKYTLLCPNCRCKAVVPPDPEGISGFPVAFLINTLKDVYSKMAKVQSNSTQCENCTKAIATGHCGDCNQFLCGDCIDTHKKWSTFSLHKITSLNEIAQTPVNAMLSAQKLEKTFIPMCPRHNKPLEIFCETCDEVICQNCTVSKAAHRDHEYDLITDSFDKQRTIIETHLKPLAESLQIAQSVNKSLKDRREEVLQRGEATKGEIHQMVDRIVNNLHHSRDSLIDKVSELTQAEEDTLSLKLKKVDLILGQMVSCQDFVQKTLELGNEQQVLISKKQMIERMKRVIEDSNITECHPGEGFNLHFIGDSHAEKHASRLGEVVLISAQHLRKCKISPILYNQVAITKGKGVSFPLVIRDSSSPLAIPASSITCKVTPIIMGGASNKQKDESSSSVVMVSSVTPSKKRGEFNATFNPRCNGTHKVTVYANSNEIGSISFGIPFSPYLEEITTVSCLQKLDSPYGVAVKDDGTVAVVECSSNTVSVFNEHGGRLLSIGSREEPDHARFNYPRGIAVTKDGHLLVSDNHKLQKITFQGEVLKCIGRSGLGDLEFSTPCGITITDDGKVYVVESGNHRVQVLNPDLSFSHKFGGHGAGPGQFTRPRDIAFDAKGNSYVTDAGNHRIQKFSPTGQFLCQIGRAGSGPGQLSRPHGIAVDFNNLVHVAEVANHRVSTFTADGVFIRSFGEEGNGSGQFKGAGGMTISSDGHLYVCDFYNKRVAVY